MDAHIAVDKIKFQSEQSDLIKTLLQNRFFNSWLIRDPEDVNKTLFPESSLEIFVTSTCNQNCEYCYLIKQPNLYPSDYNNKHTIINNLNILFDWIIENDYRIPQINYFSGEIWHTQYGLDILEITYQAIKRGLKTKMITIPSNCSFILDSVQTCKIQNYIDKFAKLNIRLSFSISIDGKIVENESRPLNSKIIKDDLYYENLFLFAHHNTYYFHPMVAASTVDKWIDNFKWWESMCDTYNCDIEKVMMLEVRNSDWTEASIQNYIEFLDFLIERQKSLCKNNSKFFDRLFNFDNKNVLTGYIPYSLSVTDTFAGCTVSDHLTVRLGDLAICPCHRMAYNKFLYGKFKVENNKIIDIIGYNPETASRILLANNNYATFKCDTCPFNKMCLKGCFGSQFETLGDPFFPIEQVCNLFMAKHSFLIKKYIQMGVLKYLQDISIYNIHYPEAQSYLQYFNEVLNYE